MTETFSKLRSLFLPVYSSEFKKFFPMAGIIFAILFNYTLLRNMKDTIIVSSAGAAAITFLKLYCVTPSAILFIVLYMKLSNIFSREKMFYLVISAFVIFFLFFGFVISPNVELFHPSKEKIDALYLAYPALQGIIDIYAYWSYSLFYICAEIWGSIGISVLFWQFANTTVKIDQSKRFYPLFIALGNMSLILCGVLVSLLVKFLKSYMSTLPSESQWLMAVRVQLFAVGVMGVVAMALFKFLNKCVLPFEIKEEKKEKKDKKKKPGLSESFKLIFQSKHLFLIACLVICYGVSINLVEVQWKNQVKIYFEGEKSAINGFMNSYSMWTGVASIVFGWFAASGILKKLSWAHAAIITPLIIGIGGVIFFISVLLKSTIINMNLNPAMIATFSGALIVIVSKVVKYALFDTTKEMSYIPLDPDLQAQGKPAVDVVGGRLGKAGGAFLQSFLLIAMATKDIATIIPFSGIFFIIAIVLWCYAVKGLGIKMKEISLKK